MIPPLKNILVAVDFSLYAEKAFTHALSLAKKYRAKLILLNVADTAYIESGAFGDDPNYKEKLREDVRQRAKEQMETMVEKYAGKDRDLVMELLVSEGEPFIEVIQCVRRVGADLLVVGSQGESGLLASFLLGGTAYKLVRNAPCPVLLVKKREEEETFPKRVLLERILIPVDFSSHSQKAFFYALSLAKRFKSEITLINVVDTNRGTFLQEGVNRDELRRNLLEKVKIDFQKFLKGEDLSGVKVQTKALDGKPFEKILEWSNSWPADLLVIGTHGRTGLLEMFLLGSTAYKVVRKVYSPILTVKPSEEEQLTSEHNANI